MNRKETSNHLAKLYLRYERGNALLNPISKVFQFGTLGILLIDKLNQELFIKYFDFSIPILVVVIIMPLFLSTLYFLGYYDEKVGFWKFQNRYTSEVLNPFFEDMGEQFK